MSVVYRSLANIARIGKGLKVSRRSVLHVFMDRFGLYCGSVYRAVGIDRDSLWRRKIRVRYRWRRNKVVDLSRLDAADAYSALAAWIVGIGAWRVFGFGISHVENVVSIDPDAARPTELFPQREKFAVLIENHN